MLDFPLITAHRNGLLFVCPDNSTRSQIAEGFAKFIGPAEIQYYSAGMLQGVIHPMTLKVMKEVGIDISAQTTKELTTIPLSHVATAIMLCSEEEAPTMPEGVQTLLWEIDDPLTTDVHKDELIYEFRRVRDEIRTNVSSLF